MKRCAWVNVKNLKMVKYHDTEWGVPVLNDTKLFEFIILESAQAGLSWETILNRRNEYRKAFKNFDPKKVARMTQEDVEKLQTNIGIIRNRLKIESSISNARVFITIQKEFGSFSAYMWSWVYNRQIKNTWKTGDTIPVCNDIAEKFSQDMKKRGFKFFGPTICYAYMQAVGMVNDHTQECFRYHKV